jgi:SAM-dependent methyltransferase
MNVGGEPGHPCSPAAISQFPAPRLSEKSIEASQPYGMTNFESYSTRFRKGEWRDRLFRDMIFEDVRPEGKGLAFLDIGCGRGFDGDIPLQRSIASVAGRFTGVEPDVTISPEVRFDVLYRDIFEEAPIAPSSIDVAYSIMVLEHLAEPERFWDKIHEVLKEGGTFWGMTVDSRHWFCKCSKLFEHLRIKNLYLHSMYGERGTERYENYPVYYRSNSPKSIDQLASKFYSRDYLNLCRLGQCNPYLPRVLYPIGALLDRQTIRRNNPGSLLVVRAQK